MKGFHQTNSVRSLPLAEAVKDGQHRVKKLLKCIDQKMPPGPPNPEQYFQVDLQK